MAISNVGNRIKALRKEHDYTLKDLSFKTNISVSFLSDIENGRSNPSLDRLKDIAAALNTTTSYLLGENDDNTNITKKEADTLAEEFLDILIKHGKIKSKEDLTPENIFSILNDIFKDIKRP
ncbi:helix-turn-helix domain-containing protein [Clostridium sporogenes]|uniref:helix-turn-helix domain-containing protein n=1 Tax=Clostridium sporogenes TaxID=1509 RepID=UPI003F91E41E